MCNCQWLTRIQLLISLSINNEQLMIINIFLFFFFFFFFFFFVFFSSPNTNCQKKLIFIYFSFYYYYYYYFLMNILTQFANQYVFNKNRLINLLEKLNYSTDFIREFRNNWIFINENQIREKMRCLCQITQDETFKDLCCHDNGIQLVFYSTPREYRFIQYRISFDVKILTLILTKHQQSMQILINNIQIKSLNHLSRPFQFCVQVNNA